MPNAQQASRRMRSWSSARVFKKDDSARRWSRQWEMRARARVQRWELLAYKNGRSFEKLKKKCFRNVVRGRELPRELLNSLNDICSTCWRGENGLRVFRITNSVFFRLSEACQEGSTLAWLTHLAEQRVERVLWKFMTKWEWSCWCFWGLRFSRVQLVLVPDFVQVKRKDEGAPYLTDRGQRSHFLRSGSSLTSHFSLSLDSTLQNVPQRDI